MVSMDFSAYELHLLQNLVSIEIERCTHRLDVCKAKNYPLVDFYSQRVKDLSKLYYRIIGGKYNGSDC